MKALKSIRKFLLFFTGTLALLVMAAAAVLVRSGLTERLETADAALVLGNQVHPDGTPSARLQARLDRAVSLYQEGFFERIIVSGGTGREGVPEGTAMKEYLVRNGVPETAVLVDDQGVNTYASARNTAILLENGGWESVFVITQYFHVPRARLALSKFGIYPIHNAHPSFFEPRDIYSILRELPAYVQYWLLPSEAGP